MALQSRGVKNSKNKPPNVTKASSQTPKKLIPLDVIILGIGPMFYDV
jgi:hypothetical protein